jgi:23S rRNA-/tRNA-specific pseudouridylate synthase
MLAAGGVDSKAVSVNWHTAAAVSPIVCTLRDTHCQSFPPHTCACRLDRNVSGAMVIARDADAAAWLAACFRDKAAEVGL